MSSQRVPPQSWSPMPELIPEAAKAKEAAIKKEVALQRAVEGFQQTQGLPSAPSQVSLAMKHGISRSTLQAHLSGCTSKIESAGQQQKICPDEEQLLVDYLQETACQGFPDTLKGLLDMQMKSFTCDLVIPMLQLENTGLISSWITTMTISAIGLPH